MALIELNIEKPALIRRETGDGESEEDDGSEVEQRADSPPEGESSTGGRGGRFGRLLGTAVVGVVGTVTLKKLRDRRSHEAEDR